MSLTESIRKPYACQYLVYLLFFASLNTAHIVADQGQPFIMTVYCFFNGIFGKDNISLSQDVPRKLLHFNGLHSPQITT